MEPFDPTILLIGLILLLASTQKSATGSGPTNPADELGKHLSDLEARVWALEQQAVTPADASMSDVS